MPLTHLSFSTDLNYVNIWKILKSPEYRKGIPISFSSTPFEAIKYLCSKCHLIPRKTRILPCCKKFICRNCLKPYIATDPHEPTLIAPKVNCPLNCGGNFQVDSPQCIYSFRPPLGDPFYEIKVKCPDGCGFQDINWKVNNHQKDACPNRLVLCPNFNCMVITKFKHMEKHYQQCPLIPTLCPTCQLYLPKEILESHNCVNTLKDVVECKDIYYFLSLSLKND